MNNKTKQKLSRSVTDARIPYLLKIVYTDAEGETENLYYCNCDYDITWKDPDTEEAVTYTGCFINITKPEKKADGIGDAKISFSTMDNEWIEKIRSSDTRTVVKFIAVVQYDENGSEFIDTIEEMDFEITNSKWDEKTVNNTLKFDEFIGISIPIITMDKRICPALA